MRFLLCVSLFAVITFAKRMKREDICSLPPVVGSCRALFSRYYYNPTSGQCETFSYGGCDGNGNNFKRPTECEDACVKKTAADCALPREVGSCRALLSRFFYNSETKKCESFKYGGCKGNKNNFAKIDDCQALCESK